MSTDVMITDTRIADTRIAPAFTTDPREASLRPFGKPSRA